MPKDQHEGQCTKGSLRLPTGTTRAPPDLELADPAFGERREAGSELAALPLHRRVRVVAGASQRRLRGHPLRRQRRLGRAQACGELGLLLAARLHSTHAQSIF